MRSVPRFTIISPPQLGIEMFSLAVKTNCTSLSDGKATDMKAVNKQLNYIALCRHVTADGQRGTMTPNKEFVHYFAQPQQNYRCGDLNNHIWYMNPKSDGAGKFCPSWAFPSATYLVLCCSQIPSEGTLN